MKEFTITSTNIFELGRLLISYGNQFSLFFKVWSEVKKEFPNEQLQVVDYQIDLIKVSDGFSYRWINIANSEDYIKANLVCFFVDDVDEYLANRE